MLPGPDREVLLDRITTIMVDKFVDISYNKPFSSSDTDMVMLYVTQVLSLGCLYLEFQNAMCEGDGLRVLKCYRFFAANIQEFWKKELCHRHMIMCFLNVKRMN